MTFTPNFFDTMKSNCWFLILALPSLAFAQDKLEPRTPILTPAPARSEWTVRISEDFPDSWATDDTWENQGKIATDPANETKSIRSISYAKDASIQTYQITTRWSNGESDEEWIVMGSHVAERPTGGWYLITSERTTVQELKVTDFAELAWVEAKHLKGVQTYKGKKVFVFEEAFNKKLMTPTEARQFAFARQADPKATPESIFKPKSSKVYAYLDVVTQLPVACNDGRKLYQYTFKAPDPGRLRPPQKIIDFLRQRNALLNARIAPPAGPGSDDTAGK
jgi:hypothetical protein